MKFNVLLLLLLLINLYKSNYSFQSKYYSVKCPDEKSKANVCAMDHTEGTISQFLIFNKCSSDKVCGSVESGYYVCIPKIKQRKNGQSCNYNEDCLSSSCISGKCGGLSEGADCSDDTPGKTCGTGLACRNGKCVKLVYEMNYPQGDGECGEGFGLDADNMCQSYGSKDNNAKISNSNDETALICKSGLAHDKDSIVGGTTTTIHICDEVEEDPVCDSSRSDYTKTVGKWKIEPEITFGCEAGHDDFSGKLIVYPKYSKLQSKLFADLKEDFDDFDLEKINTEDKYAHIGLSYKWKFYKKLLVFQYANQLKALGLIDDEGEPTDDKECEFEFIIKALSSGYMKISAFVLGVVALLF